MDFFFVGLVLGGGLSAALGGYASLRELDSFVGPLGFDEFDELLLLQAEQQRPIFVEDLQWLAIGRDLPQG